MKNKTLPLGDMYASMTNEDLADEIMSYIDPYEGVPPDLATEIAARLTQNSRQEEKIGK